MSIEDIIRRDQFCPSYPSQNFHPHLHILSTYGCFHNDGAFMVCLPPDTVELEKLFRYEIFKMLKAEGKITDIVIENMMN